ncbi:hypothetical protein Q2K19_22090 [Micromonospora soli]|uniref:hypothetical protein n=1 Tax=Micromonospora sp. NBRC 110009 TaxID=3061627 RepID=UPI00267197F1|nr:hypothetical protein [Micromonospora sp. NBRC 110009]WKT96867.1 hypothetical protein Q2K19_22090 [Micromonospora sp. NBRC 110009]
MSTPALSIDTFTATAAQNVAARVAAAQRRIADRDLARAWAAATPPAGQWCVRRLDVRVGLDPADGDEAFGARWAESICAAVLRVAASGSSRDVVHYRNDLDAAADAVLGLAAGRDERRWAWRQLGLPGDAEAVLLHRPEAAVEVLSRVVAAGGLAALHRRLGDRGWTLIAEAVWRASGGTARSAVDTAGPGSPAGLGGPGGRGRHGASVFARGALALRLCRATIRPSAAVLDAWAVLVVVEADPAAPRRPHTERAVAEARRWLADSLGGPMAGTAGRPRDDDGMATTAADSADANEPAAPSTDSPQSEAIGQVATRGDQAASAEPGRWPPGAETRPRPLTPRPDRQIEPERATGDSGGRAQAMPDPRTGRADGSAVERAPAVPEADPDRAIGELPTRTQEGLEFAFTAWAGLPFLLATAASAGLPERLFDAFEERTIGWVVHRLGGLISESGPEDAALLALAGLHGERAETVLRAPEPTEDEAALLDGIAGEWVRATADRLGHDGDDSLPEVRARLRRPGHVDAQAGWFVIHLPLASADPVVRRAGLDLDPGWVPWLGAVVRYVYD